MIARWFCGGSGASRGLSRSRLLFFSHVGSKGFTVVLDGSRLFSRFNGPRGF